MKFYSCDLFFRQVYLDLSSNKLRSLPAELGDMHTLRELLLSHNYLRVLPYELGRLFQLQTLGKTPFFFLKCCAPVEW